MDSAHLTTAPDLEDQINAVFDTLDTLNNLIYLIAREANCPDKVRAYAATADERMNILRSLL